MRKVKMIATDANTVWKWFQKDYPGEVQGGILFDDGTALVDSHYQDCCENVYADWAHLQDEAGFMSADFSDLKIERLERRNESGIRICAGGYKFFVPCYNEQNGYYSDQLDIYFVDTNKRTRKHTYKILDHWEGVPVTDEIY